MKITGVETVPIAPPVRNFYGGPMRSALGDFQVGDYAVVFVETDAGITGVGEICTVFTPAGRALCRQADDYLVPVLVGEDPFRINHLAARMNAALNGAEPAKAGLEMALFDIVGKALDTPVYNLLGGRVRERIPLSHSIMYGPPEDMAGLAAELAAQGFGTVKVKVGQGLAADVAAVRAVREAVGPEVRVRVDANMAWRTAKEAMAALRAIEPYDIELVEQPLPARDLDAMAFLRRHTALPVMADESVWTPADAMAVIRRGAADVVNVYVAESGGLAKAARTFAMCEAAGIACTIGSMPETGIATAAQIHLGIATANLGYDSDACGAVYFREDILATPLRIEEGYAYPPAGPGLGIDIDGAVLARWRAAAAKEGERR